jgi:nicotinate-nucleotide pyrophosphorylase (carboxylating)
MRYRSIGGVNKLPASHLRRVAQEALKEDIGRRDITTELCIPRNTSVRAVMLAREEFVVCGMAIAESVFRQIDEDIKFNSFARDGQLVRKGKILARLSGRARSILTAERVALNFLTLLSGVATQTRRYVDAVKPYAAKITDTRKTIPGLRQLQKYAVRIGTGLNHRMKLDEMVLIKDNHIKVMGNRSWVIVLKKIRNKISAQTKIEIEVKDLNEFKRALEARPDIIMLDNMNIKDIKKAVQIRNHLTPNTYDLIPKLEASGGINLKNVKRVASCGVDLISIGALTHSVKSVDISLEVV